MTIVYLAVYYSHTPSSVRASLLADKEKITYQSASGAGYRTSNGRGNQFSSPGQLSGLWNREGVSSLSLQIQIQMVSLDCCQNNPRSTGQSIAK